MKSSHHDDVYGGCLQVAIPACNPHQEDAFASIKPYPQEREGGAIRGTWQNIPAEEHFTTDAEIFNLRAIVTIDVGENRAKPVNRCPHGAARHKKENLYDVTVQSGEKPLAGLIGDVKRLSPGEWVAGVSSLRRRVCAFAGPSIRVDTSR